MRGLPSRNVSVWIVFQLALILTLGLILPADPLLPPPFNRISSVIGWGYFVAWSMSFYPQLLINWRLQSVSGLSLDFVILNIVGFLCYTVYNCSLYFSKTIRTEYEERFGSANVGVQLNDVVFGLHALLMTVLMGVQALVYDRGMQKISMFCKSTFSIIAATAAAYGGCVVVVQAFAIHEISHFSWLDYVYFLSSVKMLVTLVKYAPQVYLIYKRRSTKGWSMGNVWLDMTGGVLSLVQSLMDSGVKGDWTVITGNPIKFSLGFVSMAFDIIFFVQHYALYGEGKTTLLEEVDAELGEGAEQDAEDKQPLLGPGAVFIVEDSEV